MCSRMSPAYLVIHMATTEPNHPPIQGTSVFDPIEGVGELDQSLRHRRISSSSKATIIRPRPILRAMR
jgi:hypothetical protein